MRDRIPGDGEDPDGDGEDPDDFGARISVKADQEGGNKARSYIEGIYQMYDEKRAWIEAEPDNKAHRIENPYGEMELILNDFYMNDELNNAETMVAGEDLCKMFDTCLFLSELIDSSRKKALAGALKLGKTVKKQKVEISQLQEALCEAQMQS